MKSQKLALCINHLTLSDFLIHVFTTYLFSTLFHHVILSETKNLLAFSLCFQILHYVQDDTFMFLHFLVIFS